MLKYCEVTLNIFKVTFVKSQAKRFYFFLHLRLQLYNIAEIYNLQYYYE